MVKFGTAGLDLNFTLQGYKKTIEVPAYLSNMGLDAFEYQCGRGVKIKEAAAVEFGKEAAAKGITLSLHAPYYISMSSIEEEKRLNSVGYILDSAKVIKAMGGQKSYIPFGQLCKAVTSGGTGKSC